MSTSEKNRLDKNLTNMATLQGVLKAETSIIDPVILIEGEMSRIAGCNYMTIPDFKRSFFITNIRSIRTGLFEISGHVDVLSSFKEELRTNNAIISKSENDWNLYLNDGSLKTYQDSEVYTHPFPSGFEGQQFVLTIAGGSSNSHTIWIITQPHDVIAGDGDFTLSVVASGTNLTYQWYYCRANETLWRAPTSNTAKTANYIVNGRSDIDGYTYKCVILDGYGNIVVTKTVKYTYQP